MKKMYLLQWLLLFAIASFGQNRKLSGTVTDKLSKQPLTGATVVNNDKTTLTDQDGKFSIDAANGDVISVSYIGMETATITITEGLDNLIVELNSSLTEGDKVVVVGYTSQRKRDVTGAVSVVDMNPVKNNSSGNTMQALQGRVSGLYIEKTGSPNGANSRILIRGSNTLGNNDPLYVIDGIPTVRPEVFQSMDPAIIASVQVLKDASAVSIYGARASNGVIIVTTKGGGNTEGKVTFQFNSNVSFQSEKSQRFEMLDAIGRGRALWQASVNDGLDPASAYGEIYNFDWNGNFINPVLNGVSVKPFVGGDPNTPAGNTDWQDVMYKTGIATNNSLTVSVGNKTSSLEMNLAYYKNEGMLRYTGYERISGSISGLTKAFKNKVLFGTNMRIANSNETLTARDLGGAATSFLAVTLAPTIPVYQADGETFAGASGGGYSDRNNPLHMQYISRWNNTNRITGFGNVFTEIQLLKNLYFKTNLGADYATFFNKVITPTFSEGAFNRTTNSLTHDKNQYLSSTFSNTLRYNWNLNSDHQFKFLAGTEYIKTDIDFNTTRKEGFAIQTEDYFTLSAGTGNTTVSGGSSGNRLYSMFGRIDYSFADKYLLAVTIRRDGSSRFGEDNRFGFFPSASAGWRIDRENFMINSRLISELKLRIGVGRVGNQQIGDLARFGLYDTRYGTALSQLVGGFWEQYMNIGTAYSLTGSNTGILPSGFVQTQASNAQLKWETTDEINVGIDYSILDNRIFGSFDYFTRKTSGILITPPVASALGEGQTKAVNGASKANNGWEFVLGYKGNQSSVLKYNVQINLTHFRDKITELPESVRPAYPGNVEKTIIGQSQFDIFGYRTMGLFQSADEVAKAATQIGAGPGRIRYVDLNGDNVINDLDRDWIGTTLPSLEYGSRIDLFYKNFDVQIFGSGVTGRSGFDAYTSFNNLMKSRENVGPGVFNGWTVQNPNTNVPALTLKDDNGEGRTSDYFMVSTSYFKLRQLQIGYSLKPKKVFDGIRFYAMAENLFIIKNKAYQGPDPERIDIDPIPVPRTFSFGINTTF